MEWKTWNGKHVFVQLKSGGNYSGDIVDIDASDPLIIFITLIDKYGEKVTFIHSEIIKIVEENKKDDPH